MANIVLRIKQILHRFVDYLTTFKIRWLLTAKSASISFGIFLMFLIVRYIAPFGRVATYNFVSNLPGAENFLSLDKTNDKLQLGGIILKNKATRFSLQNPKNLSNINLKFNYKPGQKEIKVGIRGNESDQFIYRSLFFDPIYSLNWSKIEQNGVVLYQRTKQFDTLSAFLSSIPTDKKIATYQVDLNQLVPLIYPKLVKSDTIINTPIRGNASLYILSTGGNINIKVTKQDMNMYEGSDILNLNLSLSGANVDSISVPDDGFADDSKSQTAAQTYGINLNNARPGVYKLDLKFDSKNNDSVITKIEVNQPKVVFVGSILVWNNAPATFYTLATKVNASTSWPDSIQNLKVDDKADLAIKDTKSKFTFDLIKAIKDKPNDQVYKVSSPKGNINFGTSSYFSISPESYFDPQIIKSQVLTANNSSADIDKNFDFVLTSLSPVKEENYWLISDLNLDAKNYQIKGDKIFFSLEIPELDKQGGSLEVGGLKVALTSK